MPDFELHLEFGLVQRQGLALRQQLALRLELRQELRLSLEQRLSLDLHGAMSILGVDDPSKVRHLEIPLNKGGKLELALKIFSGTNSQENAYSELANQIDFEKKGFNSPKVIGAMAAGKNFFALTEFVKKSANVGTLLSKPDLLEKFYKENKKNMRESALVVDACKKEFVYLLGKEIRRMHEAGIIKKNISPRNLLLTIEKNGEMKIWHTGFSATSFKESTSREERLENLRSIDKAFKEFTNDEQFDRVFIRGYLGLDWNAETSLETYIEDEEEESSLPSDSAEEVSEEVREKVSTVIEETEPTEKLIDISQKIENYILSCDESELKVNGCLSEQGVYQKGIEIILNFLDSVETMSHKDSRAHSVLKYLYELLLDKEQVALADMEGCPDEDLRMDNTRASRLISPLIKKYRLPELRSYKWFIYKLIYLRVQRSNLSAQRSNTNFISDQEMAIFLEKKYGISLSRRTISAYRSEWKNSGKLPNIDALNQRKILACFEYMISNGISVDEASFMQRVNMPPESFKDYLAMLVIQYLDSQIQKAVGENTIEELNPVNLAIMLDLNTSFVIDKIEFAKSKTGQATPNGKQESLVDDVEPVTDNQHEVTLPAVDALMADVGDEVRETFVEPDLRTEENNINHISTKLVEDPAYSAELLAEELNLQTGEVQKLIAKLEERFNIAHIRRDVLILISTIPGVEDEELMEQLRVDKLTIHLCVRSELVRGAMGKGRR